jgi:hypothetical protein
MSGSVTVPTKYLNATAYAWTDVQLAANYEAQGCNAVINAMDSVPYDANLNRCDIAEKTGLINQQSYAIAAAGG